MHSVCCTAFFSNAPVLRASDNRRRLRAMVSVGGSSPRTLGCCLQFYFLVSTSFCAQHCRCSLAQVRLQLLKNIFNERGFMRCRLCRSLSVAADIVHWHQNAMACVNSGAHLQRHSHVEQSRGSHPHVWLPLFDECSHAMMTVLSFAVNCTVMVVSAASAAAASKSSSAPQRRHVDEFDLDSPSPPRAAHRSAQSVKQEHQDEPYRLDCLTPSALVLHRSQKVCLLCCPVMAAVLTYYLILFTAAC